MVYVNMLILKSHTHIILTFKLTHTKLNKLNNIHS